MNEMTVRNSGLISTLEDAERAAKAMAASGYFQDSREAAQALVKILAGQELGFGPFAAMTGVYIIQGRPGVGANLMAAAVKRSGRYDYRVTEMTDTRCAVSFYECGAQIGESVFTIEDARKAGTKNLDKFPRNMLFARAMSNGVRWYCPDVLGGGPVYTPEELGAETGEDGTVINAVVRDITPEPAPTPVLQDDDDGTKVEAALVLQAAEATVTSKGTPIGSLTVDQLTEYIEALQKYPAGDMPAQARLKAARIVLNSKTRGAAA